MKTKKLIRAEKEVIVALPPTESVATESKAEAVLTETRTTYENTIRQRAYGQWQAAGCPEGDGVEFWLEAERALASQATHGVVSKLSHEFDDTAGF